MRRPARSPRQWSRWGRGRRAARVWHPRSSRRRRLESSAGADRRRGRAAVSDTTPERNAASQRAYACAQARSLRARFGPHGCGNVGTFPTLSRPPPAHRTQPRKPSSAATPNDGHQAVALPQGRCASANIRSYTTAAGIARRSRFAPGAHGLRRGTGHQQPAGHPGSSSQLGGRDWRAVRWGWGGGEQPV